MKFLDKGFGCCSLHVSAIVILLLHAMFFGLVFLTLLFNINMDQLSARITSNISFSERIAAIFLFGALAGVFSYAFLTILQRSSSMLTTASVLLGVVSFLMIVGLISTAGRYPFSDWILMLIIDLPIAVFDFYCALILYSYKIQFETSVQVNV